MSKKYLSTGYLKEAPGKVELENGIIHDVKVCTEGAALGHGVHLDEEFIDKVVELGNEKKQGLKARFGHPSMCSTALGTFLGRFKKFRKEKTTRENGDAAFCVVADLHLSNEAKNTPNGDLFSYVAGMAANEPDMFGTSIAFVEGKPYKKDSDGNKYYRHVREHSHGFDVWYTDKDGKKFDSDEIDDLSEETFIECEALFACDCVDTPAANDGMFSKFANETIAGQISEFLDTNPDVFEALSDNPEILTSIAKYSKNVDEFFAKYKDHQQREALTMSEETKDKKAAEDKAAEDKAAEDKAAEDKAAEDKAAEDKAAEDKAAEDKAAEDKAAEDKAAEDKAAEDKAVDDDKQFSGKLLEDLVKKFGADVACQAIKKDDPYAFAADERIKALEAENTKLKDGKGEGADPAKFNSAPKTKKSIWSKK